MPKNLDISVGILSLNAQYTIERTIHSCKGIGDVIVIDNGSSDKTREIAQKNNAFVYRFLKKDQKKLREYALTKCKTEWMLFVDTDEFIDTTSLKKILATWRKNRNRFDGFWISRRNYFGKGENDYFKHGLFYPDYQLRLIRKHTTYKNTPHEEPDVDMKRTLKVSDAFISHYFNTTKLLHPFGFMKLMSFSRSYARYYVKKSTFTLLLTMFGRFIDLAVFSLIRGKGILDGWRGVMAAWNFAFHIASIYMYAIYLKVLERTR